MASVSPEKKGAVYLKARGSSDAQGFASGEPRVVLLSTLRRTSFGYVLGDGIHTVFEVQCAASALFVTRQAADRGVVAYFRASDRAGVHSGSGSRPTPSHCYRDEFLFSLAFVNFDL
jgi:hypothetical protein